MEPQSPASTVRLSSTRLGLPFRDGHSSGLCSLRATSAGQLLILHTNSASSLTGFACSARTLLGNSRLPGRSKSRISARPFLVLRGHAALPSIPVDRPRCADSSNHSAGLDLSGRFLHGDPTLLGPRVVMAPGPLRRTLPNKSVDCISDRRASLVMERTRQLWPTVSTLHASSPLVSAHAHITSVAKPRTCYSVFASILAISPAASIRFFRPLIAANHVIWLPSFRMINPFSSGLQVYHRTLKAGTLTPTPPLLGGSFGGDPIRCQSYYRIWNNC